MPAPAPQHTLGEKLYLSMTHLAVREMCLGLERLHCGNYRYFGFYFTVASDLSHIRHKSGRLFII